MSKQESDKVWVPIMRARDQSEGTQKALSGLSDWRVATVAVAKAAYPDSGENDPHRYMRDQLMKLVRADIELAFAAGSDLSEVALRYDLLEALELANEGTSSDLLRPTVGAGKTNRPRLTFLHRQSRCAAAASLEVLDSRYTHKSASERKLTDLIAAKKIRPAFFKLETAANGKDARKWLRQIKRRDAPFSEEDYTYLKEMRQFVQRLKVEGTDPVEPLLDLAARGQVMRHRHLSPPPSV